jgi:hypothetical protein
MAEGTAVAAQQVAPVDGAALISIADSCTQFLLGSGAAGASAAAAAPDVAAIALGQLLSVDTTKLQATLAFLTESVCTLAAAAAQAQGMQQARSTRWDSSLAELRKSQEVASAQLQITQARLQSFSEGEGGAPADEAAAAGLAERVGVLEGGRSAVASELEALRQDFTNLAEGLQGGQQNIESSLEQTKVSLQKADAAERRALEVEIARVGRERAHSRSPLRAFG